MRRQANQCAPHWAIDAVRAAKCPDDDEQTSLAESDPPLAEH